LFLPLILSGCCTTVTVDTCTHTFRHDRVFRIEKAVVTPDDRLVLLVEGSRAESSRVRPFTVTVALPPSGDFVRVPKEGMTRGWNSEFEHLPGAVPMTIAPVETIPTYESVMYHRNEYKRIPSAERTIYLIRHEKPDRQTELFYAEKGLHPRNIEIAMDGREIETYSRYPFLVFLPLTLAVDIATLPIQLIILPNMGDKFTPPPQPLPCTNSVPNTSVQSGLPETKAQ
jgi:hypothetical protein